MFVKPLNGRLVPDPAHGDLLPASGRTVESNQYWQRRIAEGDVAEYPAPPVVVPPPSGPVYQYGVTNAPTAPQVGNGGAIVGPNGALLTSNGINFALHRVITAPTLAAIGHSMVGHCVPTSNIIATSFTEALWRTQVTTPSNGWRHTSRSFLARAAMRSGLTWKMHRYPTASAGGGTSQQIAQLVLPTLLNWYDFKAAKLPNFMLILCAGNDAPGTTGTADTTNAVTWQRYMCDTLLSRGITPIIVSDPSRTVVANQAENSRFFEKWHILSQSLAKEYNVPWIDVYSPTVDITDGSEMAGITFDGTHLTCYAAEIFGYYLNEAIVGYISNGQRTGQSFPAWTDSTLAYRSENMMMTGALAAGTINTAGSRPTGYSAPTDPTMGTVFDLAGWKTANPSVPIPHYYRLPKIGALTEPNYQGNAWQILGNGVSSVFITRSAVAGTQCVTAAVGDLIAFYARIQWLPTTQVSGWGEIQGLCRSSANTAAGLDTQQSYPIAGADDNYQIGGTADYPAGEFYQEFEALSAQPYYDSYVLNYKGGNSSSRSGDRYTIAAPSIINLTAAGLA